MFGLSGLRVPAHARAYTKGTGAWLLTLALVGLSACGTRGPVEDPPPARQPGALVDSPDIGDAPDSLAMFYAEVERELTSSGRMRRERAPDDARFTVDDLVRNFERIALYDEYVDVGGRLVHTETPAKLRRWGRPVRIGVMTGPSLPESEASRDRANVAAFTSRLARLTGLDMRIGGGESINFLVLFMDDSERTVFARQVADQYPEFAPAVVSALKEITVDTFCTAYAFDDPSNKSAYSAVMILIRAEHPPLTRLSCVQEEMAQAMGLPNDSPDARPSLFNDDLEFALLTEHDEILLRMLYDPRLRPGMSADEVRSILPDIARDAMAAQANDGRIADAVTNTNGRS